MGESEVTGLESRQSKSIRLALSVNIRYHSMWCGEGSPGPTWKGQWGARSGTQDPCP